jgi:hypothetical protein
MENRSEPLEIVEKRAEGSGYCAERMVEGKEAGAMRRTDGAAPNGRYMLSQVTGAKVNGARLSLEGARKCEAAAAGPGLRCHKASRARLPAVQYSEWTLRPFTKIEGAKTDAVSAKKEQETPFYG